MPETTVAVLGLGTMGAGMARNLLRAGFAVRVYNRTRAKAEPFATEGATVCETPREAAIGATHIISMLADDVASREAWTGTSGALQAAEPGAVLIDSSTVSPLWIEELAHLAQERGLHVLDAPVTGSRAQAEEGKLNFIVGGSGDALQRARLVFDAMGQSVTHVGPIGSGARLKLINNFLCGVQVASLAEAIAWIERSGLDREQALNFLKGGAPGSPLLKAVSDRMVSRDYKVNFVLPLMRKDLGYAQAEAKRVDVILQTAQVAEARFAEAVAAGWTEEDMAAVVEVLRKVE